MASLRENLRHTFGRLTHRARGRKTDKTAEAPSLAAPAARKAQPDTAGSSALPPDRRRIVGDDRGPLARP